MFGAYGGTALLAVVVVSLVAVPVSIWLGHLSRRDRRLLWLVVPLNALVASLLLTGVLTWGEGNPTSYPAPPLRPGLWQDGDHPILDVRPFDSAGAPLTGIYLFDQYGRPLDVRTDCPETGGDDPGTAVVPAKPYPRGVERFDDLTGRCVLDPPAPLAVVLPPASGPTPSPSPPPPAATPPASPMGPLPPPPRADRHPPARPAAVGGSSRSGPVARPGGGPQVHPAGREPAFRAGTRHAPLASRARSGRGVAADG